MELETLAEMLDANITHIKKESLNENLHSLINIITKNVYNDVDDT